MSNYVPKFVTPKTPNIGNRKGYLIIETDDNNIGDYTHWRPIINKIKYEKSQWVGTDFLSMGINTNVGMLGVAGKVTAKQLTQMHQEGCEVINHGRYHTGLGRHYLQTDVVAGSTEIFLDNTYYFGHGWYILNTGYKFEIISENGIDREIVEVLRYDSSTSKNNSVTLKNPISKSFNAGSYFQLSSTFLENFITESRNELEVMGFEVNSFSPPYNAGSFYSKNVFWRIR